MPKLGRVPILQEADRNIGTYSISTKAWNGLRFLAMQYGYVLPHNTARGIVPFLRELKRIDAEFYDNRPDYLKELDTVAKAYNHATVWHEPTEPGIKLRLANMPRAFLINKAFDHNISDRNRQSVVARGFNLVAPRAFAPTGPAARISAVLEAIGLGYLALTDSSRHAIEHRAPTYNRALAVHKKLVG